MLLPGAGWGSLCLLAGLWQGKQMPGLQSLPGPYRTVRSWVCSLCTLPLPTQLTNQAPACLSAALTVGQFLQRGLTPQLSPKLSRTRGKLGGTREVEMSC